MSNKLGEGADHLSALLEASLKEDGDENRALATQQPRAQVGGSDEDQQDRLTEEIPGQDRMDLDELDSDEAHARGQAANQDEAEDFEGFKQGAAYKNKESSSDDDEEHRAHTDLDVAASDVGRRAQDETSSVSSHAAEDGGPT